jgi:asparagine synthetase B (glutamine-hydrolysing)
MCGIFFSLSTRTTHPNQETKSLLEKRGPDSIQTHTVRRKVKTQDAVSQPLQHLIFISTVLSLRGDHVYSQPLIDPVTQSVLCWNGEAWKIAGEPVSGNDTERVFNLFLQAVSGDSNDAAHKLAEAVATISGPFAFVYYDAVNARLFFSRDCLGRRSLLQGFEEDGSLKICSLCDGSSSALFEEVGFAGIYMINLDAYQDTPASLEDQYKIETLPWSSDPSPPAGHIVSLTPCLTLLVLTFHHRRTQFRR